MGLNFSKSSTEQPEVIEVAPDQEPGTDLVVKPYDIVADRNNMNTQLVNSPEVDAIVSTIEVNNMESIVSFGANVAEEISKASEHVSA